MAVLSGRTYFSKAAEPVGALPIAVA